MSKRQDRQGVRTPADVERKYNLGARLAEIMGIINAHKSAQEEISAETDELSRELEDLKGEYAQASAEMRETVSDIEDDMKVTKQELVNAKDDIDGLRSDLVPLAEFSDGEYSGIAGFVARANADSASIGILLEYTQDNDVTLAAFMAEAAKEFATITALTAVDTKHTNALAGFITEASKTYASIEALASFENETNEAIAGVRQEASEKYALIESLTSLETETNKAIAGFKSEVEDTYAKQSVVTALDTKHTNALSGFEQEVSEKYATQEMVTSLNTNQSNALAGFKTEVSKTYATQNALTALETANSKALADFGQEVSDNYVNIWQIAELVDENGAVTTSAILQAINDGKSSILLRADRIDLSGYVTVNGFQNGTTEINGACIKTGVIRSASNAMYIDLDNSVIEAANFKIDSSGCASLHNAYADSLTCVNADVSGKITSSEGLLGSVEISSRGLECGDTLLSSEGISTSSNGQTTVLAGGVLRFGGSVTIYAPTQQVSGGFLGVYQSGSWRTLYFDESTGTVKFI